MVLNFGTLMNFRQNVQQISNRDAIPRYTQAIEFIFIVHPSQYPFP
jgi:hypothetical protein